MGDFTSKYRVRYSDGTTATETRVDGGKVVDNGLAPLMILALLVLAFIASIPFLVLMPLYLYMNTPYKRAKNLVKSDESVLEYVSEYLSTNGYKNFQALYNAIKIKYYIFMVVFILAGVGVDYFVFSTNEINPIGRFISSMFMASLSLLFAYPIFMLMMHKNRKVLLHLLEEESTLAQRMFRFVARHYKKTIASLVIFFGTIFGVVYANSSYLENQAYNAYDYGEPFYMISDKKLTKKEFDELVSQTKLKMQDVGLDDINEYFYGNTTLYNIALSYDEFVGGEDFKNDEYYKYESMSPQYESMNLLEYVLVHYYDEDSYAKNYQKSKNKIKLFLALGGDLNTINPSTQKPSIIKVSTVDMYNVLKEEGVKFDGVEYEVLSNIIKSLGKKDGGYSKKLAQVAKELIVSKEIAQKLYDEVGIQMKYDRQISALNVIEQKL